MIVSGETSGELYGALLAQALLERMPELTLCGIGGERMKAAGVKLISGISSAFGLAEAVSSLRTIRDTFRKAVRALADRQPAVLVLIDYPDFNLRLAAEARKRGIRILYYVSPQVWAWRGKRVAKIASLVDKMAVVLPFEADIYDKAGLACEFVGHPVYDEIREMNTDRKTLKKVLGLNPDRQLLSLLPGSRPHEIDRLLPVLANVVEGARREFRDMQFAIPFAPNTDLARYDAIIGKLRREGGVLISRGDSLRTLAASDLAVVASGTASLQAALLGVPMVVIYKLFPLTFWMGKLMVRVKHISLVNILAGREVVTELIQSQATPQKILEEVRRMTGESPYKQKMLEAYEKVTKMFSQNKASERVAEMVMEMAGWKGRSA